LAEAAQGAFVGRAGELRALEEALRAPHPPFAAAYIYGPGGIGKSALLRTLFDSLPPDYLQIRLDCRDVEPTAEGALSAIAAAIGGGIAADLSEISQYLGRGARRVVVAFDTYETFGLLDTWLRQTLMPALPDSAITLMASREPPSPGWTTSPGWAGMFREIELEGLDESQSLEMLQSRGLSEAQARRINEFTRGHPLALELAAAAGRAHPALEIEKAAIPRVVARLTEMLLTGIDQKTVDALEAGAMVRRITEPLLAALLRTDSARAQFEALRQLPFVSAVRDGLILHDLMRDTISYGLAQRDPNKYITYRLRAWRYLNEVSHRSEKSSLWQYTADLLYLVQNPNVRNAFFRPSAIEVSIESATPPTAMPSRRFVRASSRPLPRRG
jgi:hypothetical protein